MVGRRWVYVGAHTGNKPSVMEKSHVAAACEKLITNVLKPRFLPEIRPTAFNYPIAIYGKWHGTKYRFITRYRSDDPASLSAEFEAPFARLGYLGRDRFELSWHRHTGEWLCLHRGIPLAEALRLIETEGYFQPC